MIVEVEYRHVEDVEEEPSECGEDEEGRGGALERRGALVPPRSGLAKYCKQDKRSQGATY